MRKVLIADDEKNICLMIQKMIDWESFDMQVIGMVHNGVQALETIRAEHPDIIISDIRMPGYDGLELIRRTQETEPDAIFIIISGYKYFEYAHMALNLGVEHYLLKPIDKSELENTLQRIRKKYEDSAIRKQKEDLILQEADITRRKMKHYFLTSIIDTKRETVSLELEHVNSEYQCDFTQGCFEAMFIKLDCENKTPNWSGLLLMTEELLDKAFEGQAAEYINNQVQSGVITLLNYVEGKREIIQSLIGKILHQICHELEKFYGYHVTIGVGTEQQSIATIYCSINEAVHAVECRGKAGMDRIIYYDRLHYRKIPVGEIFEAKDERELEKIVEMLDFQALSGLLSYHQTKMEGMVFLSPAVVFEYEKQVCNICYNVLRNNRVDENLLDEMQKEIEQTMDSVADVNLMLYKCLEIYRKYFDEIRKKQQNRSQLPIRIAKQYIQDNFRNQISLEKVAEETGLSTAYLSQLFKKEMGINFIDYLTSCRMEEAKRLLKSTDLSVAEISGMVGYLDSRYFSKAFVKAVGLKPTVYRKIYQ